MELSNQLFHGRVFEDMAQGRHVKAQRFADPLGVPALGRKPRNGMVPVPNRRDRGSTRPDIGKVLGRGRPGLKNAACLPR
jgi:hypothetical protein